MQRLPLTRERVIDLLARHADNRKLGRYQSLQRQPKESRNEFAFRKVAGSAKDHHNTGISRLLKTHPRAQRIFLGLRHLNR